MTDRPASVLAIVLTYDAPEAVVDCIQNLTHQQRRPDEILVVDNAGARAAATALAAAGLAQAATVHRTDANLGPAGGYSAGLAWFLDSPHDAAWVMDDDCVPDPDALAALERAAVATDRPTVVFPQEVDGLDGTLLNNPSWSGVWLPRQVVETVGLPRADFFWWMEDTEYFRHRMRAHDVPVIRVSDARTVQSRPRRGGPVPVWKYYYETRNSAYMYLRHHPWRPRPLAKWLLRIVRRFGGLLVRSDQRAAAAGAFLQGLLDGARGRLGKRFPVG